ncbi:MAG: preQ(1) synthase [Pseudomonadota bacterium]
MFSECAKRLRTIDNPNPGRNRMIRITIPDFSCICPLTKRTDIATVYVSYIPEKSCIELLSLREYVYLLKNEKALHESIPCFLLDDLKTKCQPRYMKISAHFRDTADFDVEVSEEYTSPDWEIPPHFTTTMIKR